jgi:hypothetical protein
MKRTSFLFSLLLGLILSLVTLPAMSMPPFAEGFTWATMKALNSPHARHPATLLPRRNVLAAGSRSLLAHAATLITRCDETTLRTAISDPSLDTIQFSMSRPCIITLTQGPIIITRDLTLDASGSPQPVTLSGGDAVQVLQVNSGITFLLNTLTIAHGSAGFDTAGGGLFADMGSTVTISNSTFAHNSATMGDGGGLANSGTMSISNSTFAYNSADEGGGLANGGTVHMAQSIVAHNSASTGNNCFPSLSLPDPGYNLESDTDCGFTASTSLQKTDPKLASALANNGGPTPTLALLDGSPAINKIPTSVCALTTDQRAVSRPQGPACDMGAFEDRAPVLSLPSSPSP